MAKSNVNSKTYYDVLNKKDTKRHSNKNNAHSNHKDRSLSSSIKYANFQTNSKVQDISILPFPVNFMFPKNKEMDKTEKTEKTEGNMITSKTNINNSHVLHVNYCKMRLPPPSERYAGPSYATSPDPSTLPLPSEFLLSDSKNKQQEQQEQPETNNIIVLSQSNSNDYKRILFIIKKKIFEIFEMIDIKFGNCLSVNKLLKSKLLFELKFVVIKHSNNNLLLHPSFVTNDYVSNDYEEPFLITKKKIDKIFEMIDFIFGDCLSVNEIVKSNLLLKLKFLVINYSYNKLLLPPSFFTI